MSRNLYIRYQNSEVKVLVVLIFQISNCSSLQRRSASQLQAEEYNLDNKSDTMAETADSPIQAPVAPPSDEKVIGRVFSTETGGGQYSVP